MRSIAATLLSLLLFAAAAQAGEAYSLHDGEGLRDVVIGVDGRLWLFTTQNFNPTSEVVVGSDGRFWFGTATGVSALDINGNVTNFATGRAVPSVAAAPYGGVWYARTTPEIGYVDAHGDASERTAPTATPYDIAVAAGGTIWLTQMYAANAVFRIAPSGDVATLTLPVRCYGGRITTAADATVWITSAESSAIAHLDAGGRLLELVNVPKDVTWNVRPLLAADGALWLGERNGLVRIAGGVSTHYALAAPSFCANAFYRYVPRAQAADGSLWISRELISTQSCQLEPTVDEARTLVMRVEPQSLVPDRGARRRSLR